MWDRIIEVIIAEETDDVEFMDIIDVLIQEDPDPCTS